MRWKISSSEVEVEIFEGTDYGFCVIAIDQAGNEEQKDIVREGTLANYILGDANSDNVVDIQDAVLIVHSFLETPGAYINFIAADFNKDGLVDIQDAVGIVDRYVTSGIRNKPIRKRINFER